MSAFEVISTVVMIATLVLAAVQFGRDLNRKKQQKVKPPSISQMVDGRYPFGNSLCRGEKPNQKRRPFLPLFYHIQRQMSTLCKRSNLWPVNPQIVPIAQLRRKCFCQLNRRKLNVYLECVLKIPEYAIPALPPVNTSYVPAINPDNPVNAHAL